MRHPLSLHVEQVLGNDDLSLTADAGESFLVVGLRIHNPSADYVTVETAQTSVGYWRVGGTQGNHLYFPEDAHPLPNLMEYLYALGLFPGYPVGEGETFRLSGVAQADAVQQAIYLRGAANDYKPTDHNGSESPHLTMVSYGRPTSACGDGDNLFDDPQTPVQFPAFPWGAVAPQNRQVRLHGLCLSDVGKTSDSQGDQQQTEYLRLVQERKTLFDLDRNGLLCLGEASTTADQTDVAIGQNTLGNRTPEDQSEPLLFAEPLVYAPNEELNVYVHTSVESGSANFSLGDAEVGAILEFAEGR